MILNNACVRISRMPLIASAKKKLRKDRKRTLHNKVIRDTLKGNIKGTRNNPTKEKFAELFSSLDKAVKTNLMHKNKAARIKSRLTKAAAAK